MKRSIYAQLVLVYIFIIFLGNFAAQIFGSFTIDPVMAKEISNALIGELNVSKSVFEKGGTTVEELEKLYSSGIVTVKFYENINDVALNYHLSSEDLSGIKEDPITFGEKEKIGYRSKTPIGIVKSGDMYTVAALHENSAFSSFRSIILRYNFLSIFFGTIVMLFAAHFIVEPIKRLTSATERIAKGDFIVQIKKDRKDEIGQ